MRGSGPAPRGECPDVRVREVLDVDEVAGLPAVARDGDRRTRQGGLHEAGDDELVAHPRAVRNPVPQDREVAAVELAVAVDEHLRRQLAGDVEVAAALQLDGDALVELVPVEVRLGQGRAVHPDGAGQDGAAQAAAAGRLQHGRGAVDVEPHGPDGIGADLFHVGHRGQVEHHLAAVQDGGQRGRVEDVDAGVLGARVEVPLRGVDREHLVPGLQQPVHHVGADEPASSGHCYAHSFSLVRSVPPLVEPRVPGQPASRRWTWETAPTTWSISSSVMSVCTGRQTWRAHTSSATGSGPPR